jgi:hypothetical protein
MGGMSWLQDHRQPSLQDALDQLEHVARLLDAERGGRLVHAHDAPAPSRGTRDGDALALAAGEAPRPRA